VPASRKVRVAILFGGRSAEHEISILSARFVLESLDRDRFEPVLVGIDKAGRWLLQEETVLLQAAREPRLQKLGAGPMVTVTPYASSGDGAIELDVRGAGPRGVDVVFPVLHGPLGEDGCLQGLLELTGVPFVGSGVLGSAAAMDKDVMKRLLAQADIPVVPGTVVKRRAWDQDRTGQLAECAALGMPLFVKPANLGSSVGIRKVCRPDELEPAILHAFEFDRKVIVEAGLTDMRELECAVLGGSEGAPEPVASLPGEIIVEHEDGFYSYDAKYVDDRGARTVTPADLSPSVQTAVQSLALRVFDALECEGLARVDFFLSAQGDLYVNELNTMPGMTAISMFPKMWQASGVGGRELCSRLVDAALSRARERSILRTTHFDEAQTP